MSLSLGFSLSVVGCLRVHYIRIFVSKAILSIRNNISSGATYPSFIARIQSIIALTSVPPPLIEKGSLLVTVALLMTLMMMMMLILLLILSHQHCRCRQHRRHIRLLRRRHYHNHVHRCFCRRRF